MLQSLIISFFMHSIKDCIKGIEVYPNNSVYVFSLCCFCYTTTLEEGGFKSWNCPTDARNEKSQRCLETDKIWKCNNFSLFHLFYTHSVQIEWNINVKRPHTCRYKTIFSINYSSFHQKIIIHSTKSISNYHIKSTCCIVFVIPIDAAILRGLNYHLIISFQVFKC